MKTYLVVFLMFGFTFFSAQSDDKTAIEATVKSFFDAMKNADPEALKKTFSETIVFQTISKNGNVVHDKPQEFAASLSKFGKGDLDEQFKIKKILIDGPLASVWMEYRFLFKGKVSHCGVNSFQMVKNAGIWKVQYIIDTRRKCEK